MLVARYLGTWNETGARVRRTAIADLSADGGRAEAKIRREVKARAARP